MTAVTVAERVDAVTALFAGPFVAGCALLIVFAVAYVHHAEKRARTARAARRRRASAIDAHLSRLPHDLEL